MNNTYRKLETDTDFFVAALSQTRVSVWIVLQDREEIMDYGGVVEAYSNVSVKIAGSRYFRDKFEFRVQVKGTTST
ncbi:hypothetical protein PAECIP111890_04373 [Paenibacillus sp. JJ-223]|nr:hypothetical protein [Paenibacillus sp. JJ-223]CAH1216196.1 hypothetical protein PAECIP111890_04373 [Paenibacillus sp. JJ-223]